jgi:hypothetical protein
MPVLDFGVITGNGGIQTEVGLVRLSRVIGRGVSAGGITASISIAGRLRGPAEPLIAQIYGGAQVDLKRLLRLGAAQGFGGVKTLAQYFLNAMATPAPFGRLLVPSADQIFNPNATPRGFGGYRFVRGNSVPIEFTVRGQRLDGFNATFTACRVDEPIGSPHDINKVSPGSIRQTEAVRDTTTGLETMTGVIQLTPADTASLPDGEIEFIFEFKVADGNGRVHTLEHGKFKVYSVC